MPEFDWTPYAGDRWTPEKVGDRVEGRIIDIRTEEGRKGLYPVLTLQIDAAGNRREVHPPTDLQRKLAESNVQVGDWVKAELTDLKHTGQPSPMKIFKLATKTGQAAPETIEFSARTVEEVPLEPLAAEVEDVEFADYDDSPF